MENAKRRHVKAQATVIRPDQHVAWRGDELPHDADALIAQVTGS